jgi:hypothetical protein
MNEALRSNLMNRETWLRLAYMFLFAIAFGVAELVTVFVVVVQFATKLFTGQVNQRLAEFGEGLSIYFRDIVRFMTFQSEKMPYPFAPWPETSDMTAPPDAVTEI